MMLLHHHYTLVQQQFPAAFTHAYNASFDKLLLGSIYYTLGRTNISEGHC